MQMQNCEGYTPLTLAIQASIGAPESDRISSTETFKLLLDACERDVSCRKCVGSLWDLVTLSGSARVVKSLAESGVPFDFIQQGQPTPIHVLDEQAPNECVESLMELLPGTKGLQYWGLTQWKPSSTAVLSNVRCCNKGLISRAWNNGSCLINNSLWV
ncbi:hypothetical protein F5B21DRAFT_477471 [Xylaria acuta]|nr:hypothetical protein F5B21DRAFT_477471 [Xylaria acuta]